MKITWLIFLISLVELYSLDELWRNPNYMVVSPTPLCIDATFHVAKELFDEKGEEFVTDHIQNTILETQRSLAWHNIRLAVKSIRYWTTANLIPIGSTVETTTPAYSNYIKSVYDSSDIYVLFVNINNNVVNLGKSYLGGVCTQNAYSVVQAGMRTSWNYSRASSILAHEIGHLMNFGHVTGDNLTCNCPWENNYCLMQPLTYNWNNPLPRSYDSCSMKSLLANTPKCLLDCDRTIFQEVPDVCGNNIIDYNEDCDCGFKEACELTQRNKCCNPETCKFVSNGMQCSEGSCCTNCMFKSGNICRPSADECDIPDFCPGNNQYCETNNIRQNGLTCSNGNAYCFEGHCYTKDYYCKRMFPSSNVTYSDKCYSIATQYASTNCKGLTSQNYISMFCASGKGECGQVYCEGTMADPYYSFSVGANRCYTLLDSSADVYANKVPYPGRCGTNGICSQGECFTRYDILSYCYDKQCEPYAECDENSGTCVPNDPRWFST